MNADNSFISYINSLHSLDGNSDGALAEMQATSPYFTGIQVVHPWVKVLEEKLLNGKEHVILTGRAGDGKSTLALSLYKKLKGIDSEKPLDCGLNKKEEVPYEKKRIILIKDLSEWTVEEQDQLLEQMTYGHDRYLLVSNTGTLLDMFRRNATDKVAMESNLLTAISSSESQSQEFQLRGDKTVKVCVHNLGLRNNSDVALKLWDNMVATMEWNKCETCSIAPQCPVYHNVRLVKQYEERIHARLRLLLLRITEYGGRLTIRQLSAYFAYMLSSGESCEHLKQLAETGQRVYLGDYLFFNKFFGEGATEPDVRAKQLHMLKVIQDQGFETILAPAMERRLWLTEEEAVWKPNISELADLYKELHDQAKKEPPRESGETQNMNSAIRARQQIRRLFYFLYEPQEIESEKKVAFNEFISAFLNSPTLLEYEEWQKNGEAFFGKKKEITNQVFRVLQEQFCGVRLPKRDRGGAKILYITLARRQGEVSQSAQVVLGMVSNFDGEFALHLRSGVDKKNLVLMGKSTSRFPNREMIELSLPLLDYMKGREQGRIGATLERSYIDRLEKLKNDILQKYKITGEEELTLLKQTLDYELIQHSLSLQNGGNLYFNN